MQNPFTTTFSKAPKDTYISLALPYFADYIKECRLA